MDVNRGPGIRRILTTVTSAVASAALGIDASPGEPISRNWFAGITVENYSLMPNLLDHRRLWEAVWLYVGTMEEREAGEDSSKWTHRDEPYSSSGSGSAGT